MPSVRHILSKLSVHVAERRRICHRDRNNHGIAKGEICLVIEEHDRGSKNYCRVHAKPILEQARADLDSLTAQLDSGDGIA